MEIELVEIRDFLAQRPPFDSLPDEQLNMLTKALQIRYLRRGLKFPPEKMEGSYLYIVRSGLIDLLDDEGHLVEKLDAGGYFASPCHFYELGPATQGIAQEDCLLYIFPCSKLQELKDAEPEFARHFSESLRERLRHAVITVQNATDTSRMAQMTMAVSNLVHKAPVTADINISIQEAAHIMTQHQVSCLMLTKHEHLTGIITDRDLRQRCIAEGVSPDKPVKRIASRKLHTIEHNEPILRAIVTMTRNKLNHLPVMDGNQIKGMLTVTDIARLQTMNPAFLASDISKAKDLDELANICRRLPDLQSQLSLSSLTAQSIGDIFSTITDSVTLRLIEMAEAELGPPPVPYVWLCAGSQARREQSAHSDQDNALLISDKLHPEHEAWFDKLATKVCSGLDACGYTFCPGNAMAMNPQWRQQLKVWRKYFDEWINKPEPMALMLSSIFFDLRPVCGEKELFETLQQEILKKSKESGIFIAYMASNALQFRPPLGFFRTFVLIHEGEHADTFDLKHRGIVPITDIARVLALSQGLSQTNTSERLRAAEMAHALSIEMGENLKDALEFIASLRINHQADQIRLGLKPDNYLPPDDLSDLERKHLKDAFKVIQAMQSTLESRYQGGRFR